MDWTFILGHLCCLFVAILFFMFYKTKHTATKKHVSVNNSGNRKQDETRGSNLNESDRASMNNEKVKLSDELNPESKSSFHEQDSNDLSNDKTHTFVHKEQNNKIHEAAPPVFSSSGIKPVKDISAEDLNFILKGILFAQEMYKYNKIDHFCKAFPQKYNFMFKRGNQDEIIFQGSTAENLAIFRMTESNPEFRVHQEKWFRWFDYDIMHVQHREVIDDYNYITTVCAFMNSNKNGSERWEKGEFCKHENEPFVMLRVVDKNDEYGILPEHVGIIQPACDVCITRPKGTRVTTKYNGRVALVKTPVEFFMDFVLTCIKIPKEEEYPEHSCQFYAEAGEDFNRHGDLCWKCRELNSATIDHGDAVSQIFLDKIVNAGPSVMLRFYMDHNGESKFGLPLFNDPGVSTIDVDNIPALRFPLLDWTHWSKLLRSAGIPNIPANLMYRWPYDCQEFSKPKTQSGWPSLRLKNKVMEAGCHLVPRSPKPFGLWSPKTWMQYHIRGKTDSDTPGWRVSFSVSEKMLVDNFTMPQRKCFLLLKVILTTLSITVNEALERKHGEDNFKPFKVSGFLLKHTMFWTMEQVDLLEWRMNNLHACVLHVIRKFERFLKERNIPHY